MMSFGGSDNYILCPGHATGLETFQSPPNFYAYVTLKAVTKELGLPLKSYQLKKLVLNSEMAELSLTVASSKAFLLAIVRQPECRALFEEKVDLDKTEAMEGSGFFLALK